MADKTKINSFIAPDDTNLNKDVMENTPSHIISDWVFEGLNIQVNETLQPLVQDLNDAFDNLQTAIYDKATDIVEAELQNINNLKNKIIGDNNTNTFKALTSTGANKFKKLLSDPAEATDVKDRLTITSALEKTVTSALLQIKKDKLEINRENIGSIVSTSGSHKTDKVLNALTVAIEQNTAAVNESSKKQSSKNQRVQEPIEAPPEKTVEKVVSEFDKAMTTAVNKAYEQLKKTFDQIGSGVDIDSLRGSKTGTLKVNKDGYIHKYQEAAREQAELNTELKKLDKSSPEYQEGLKRLAELQVFMRAAEKYIKETFSDSSVYGADAAQRLTNITNQPGKNASHKIGKLINTATTRNKIDGLLSSDDIQNYIINTLNETNISSMLPDISDVSVNNVATQTDTVVEQGLKDLSDDIINIVKGIFKDLKLDSVKVSDGQDISKITSKETDKYLKEIILGKVAELSRLHITSDSLNEPLGYTLYGSNKKHQIDANELGGSNGLLNEATLGKITNAHKTLTELISIIAILEHISGSDINYKKLFNKDAIASMNLTNDDKELLTKQNFSWRDTLLQGQSKIPNGNSLLDALITMANDIAGFINQQNQAIADKNTSTEKKETLLEHISKGDYTEVFKKEIRREAKSKNSENEAELLAKIAELEERAEDAETLADIYALDAGAAEKDKTDLQAEVARLKSLIEEKDVIIAEQEQKNKNNNNDGGNNPPTPPNTPPNNPPQPPTPPPPSGNPPSNPPSDDDSENYIIELKEASQEELNKIHEATDTLENSLEKEAYKVIKRVVKQTNDGIIATLTLRRGQETLENKYVLKKSENNEYGYNAKPTETRDITDYTKKTEEQKLKKATDDFVASVKKKMYTDFQKATTQTGSKPISDEYYKRAFHVVGIEDVLGNHPGINMEDGSTKQVNQEISLEDLQAIITTEVNNLENGSTAFNDAQKRYIESLLSLYESLTSTVRDASHANSKLKSDNIDVEFAEQKQHYRRFLNDVDTAKLSNEQKESIGLTHLNDLYEKANAFDDDGKFIGTKENVNAFSDALKVATQVLKTYNTEVKNASKSNRQEAASLKAQEKYSAVTELTSLKPIKGKFKRDYPEMAQDLNRLWTATQHNDNHAFNQAEFKLEYDKFISKYPEAIKLAEDFKNKLYEVQQAQQVILDSQDDVAKAQLKQLKQYNSDVGLENIDYMLASSKAIESTINQSQKATSTTSQKSLDMQQARMIAQMETFKMNNDKFMGDANFAGRYESMMHRVKNSTVLSKEAIADLKLEWVKFQTDVKSSGLNKKSGKSSIEDMFSLYNLKTIVTGAIGSAASYVHELYQSVLDIDKAMTELKRVTDETDATYNRFLDRSGDKAKDLGTTMSDMVEASAAFARLGYDIDASSNLAESAILYSNVGDIDISTATDDLVSALKAFNLEASQSVAVVDKLNQVGNNFAISSEKIGAGLNRSSSALAAAGNNIDESIAMVTAISEITQDAESAGAALKILSLRLRGTKSELEEMGEDTEGVVTNTAKLQGKIKGLTGVDILEDENTYKSTYQIMKEISEVWDTLSDTSQASLLETIAGKNRANQVAALLSNFSQAEAAYETALDSAGSAMKENETYLDSINGKIAVFKASLQELATSAISFDLIKVPFEIGNGAVNFLDNFLVDTDAIHEAIDKEFFKGMASSPTLIQGLTNEGIMGGLGEIWDSTIWEPAIENVQILIDGIKSIPDILDTIIKSLKIMPALVGAISAVATVQNKNLGKLICPLF